MIEKEMKNLKAIPVETKELFMMFPETNYRGTMTGTQVPCLNMGKARKFRIKNADNANFLRPFLLYRGKAIFITDRCHDWMVERNYAVWQSESGVMWLSIKEEGNVWKVGFVSEEKPGFPDMDMVVRAVAEALGRKRSTAEYRMTAKRDRHNFLLEYVMPDFEENLKKIYKTDTHTGVLFEYDADRGDCSCMPFYDSDVRRTGRRERIFETDDLYRAVNRCLGEIVLAMEA